jgi:hypothetical protein
VPSKVSSSPIFFGNGRLLGVSTIATYGSNIRAVHLFREFCEHAFYCGSPYRPSARDFAHFRLWPLSTLAATQQVVGNQGAKRTRLRQSKSVENDRHRIATVEDHCLVLVNGCAAPCLTPHHQICMQCRRGNRALMVVRRRWRAARRHYPLGGGRRLCVRDLRQTQVTWCKHPLS